MADRASLGRAIAWTPAPIILAELLEQPFIEHARPVRRSQAPSGPVTFVPTEKGD
jgi:hypothetical protein